MNEQAPSPPASELVARRFHEVYEARALDFGYRTRTESAVPWDEVPEPNKNLMLATAAQLLDEGFIILAEEANRQHKADRDTIKGYEERLREAGRLCDDVPGSEAIYDIVAFWEQP